jgi:cell shape-determining protein MreC
VSRGDYVVTAGKVSCHCETLFPPGIPIGRVTSENEQSPFKSVNVSPLANLHNLDVVQVLTHSSSSRAATLSGVAASLTPGGSSEGEGSSGQLASTGG